MQIPGGHHHTFLIPSPIHLLSSSLFLDSLASAKIREETQPQPIPGTPLPRDENINTYEGGLMISGEPCPPAIGTVQTEVPTTEGMIVLLNSKDSMSSVMFSESSEEIEPECAKVESSRPHRFALASTPANSGTPPPIVLEATPMRNFDELSNLNLESTAAVISLRSRANRYYHT